MNILITGGTGFLGRHLVPYIKSQGDDITVINTKNCDLTEKSNLLKFKDEKFDRIYHLAAWAKAGDFCLYHKGDYWLINQQINTNILWYWKEFQHESLMISMGTSCAYPPDLELKEENYMIGEPDKDLYPYALSKRMLYEGLRSLNDQFDMNYCYLVPCTLYGPQFDLNDSHFIFDLIKKIIIGKKYNKTVELWGDGNQVRELIYIDDAIHLIDIFTNTCKNDLINLGSGVGYSIKQYAKMICDIVDYDYSLIQYNTSRYSGVIRKVFNTEKIRKMSNFQFTSIEEGLKNTINYYLKYEM